MNIFAVLRNRLTRYLRRLTGRHEMVVQKKKKKKKPVVKIQSNTSRTLLVIIAVATALITLFTLGLVLLLINLNTPSSGRAHYYSDNHHLQMQRQRQDHHLHIEPRGDRATVDVLALGRITSDVERAERETGYRLHAFNTLISDRLGFRSPLRPLPDTRHQLCKGQQYDELVVKREDKDDNENNKNNHQHKLLTTSVIICFYNEHFSTLQRTVYSVLERTPRHLLQEIILVDDHSNDTLAQQLVRYIEEQAAKDLQGDYRTKVQYRRVPERAGLIRARLYGTRFAQGQVLVFLDSHCEVNTAWLEPLLSRIALNPKTIACPVIDLIDADTLQYRASPLVRGGFNWGLHFRWDAIEELDKPEDFIRPVASPTMAGGLFAIRRRYFHELGEYDEGMKIWGGENLELSFRVWMCGGRLEIVPCSRVGHIFRKRRPYSSGREDHQSDDKNGGNAAEVQDTLAYNSLRVAHVWMDDYKKYFLASRSDLADMDYGDIRSRLKLRHHRLNCSTFEWYLQTVYPQLQTPKQAAQSAKERSGDGGGGDKNDKKPEQKNLFKPATPPATLGDAFQLQLDGSKFCLTSPGGESTFGRGPQGLPLSVAPCARASRLQRWRRTEADDIRLGPKACLAVGNDRRLRVALTKCHQQGGTQLWQIEKKKNTSTSTTNTVQLYNPGSGLCLGAMIEKKEGKNDDDVHFSPLLEELVGDERLKPAAAAALVHLKMSFCGNTGELEQNTQKYYTNWRMQAI